MFSKDILERAEKREQRSQEYKQRFESGDEKALREFCRIDPFAIKTSWVQKAIEKCLLTGKMNPLKNLFIGGNKKGKNRFTEFIENLVIKDGINQVASETGLPKIRPEVGSNNTAFDYAYNKQLFTFGTVQKMEPRTLFNRYHEAKKQTPEIMIEHNKRGILLRCGPTKVSMDGKNVFGFFEHFYPADGGDMEIAVNIVCNKPLGKNLDDVLPDFLNPAN